MEIQRKDLVVDGLVTSYLEAGQGDPVILLHGGEFGVTAEIGWERTIPALVDRYRVLAPDMLGFGQSAKVIDFNDGRGMRIRHIARFCDELGVTSAHFVGNSMGAINLLTDVTSDSPVLPMRSMVAICGGGEIQRNQYMEALYDYDASLPAMRRIVEALFHDPSYPADDDYVQRRSRCVGGARRGPFPPARRCTAAGTVEQTGLRARLGSDACGRGRLRQIAAAWLGERDRRPDFQGTVSRGRGGRSLPADRAIGSRQRAAAAIPVVTANQASAPTDCDQPVGYGSQHVDDRHHDDQCQSSTPNPQEASVFGIVEFAVDQ